MLSAALAVSLAVAPAEPWKSTAMPGPMPAPKSHQLLPVNGVSLYVARYGAGDPVILLHGGAGNSDHWANQVPALASSFEVIVVDTRGHGRSTRDARPMSYAQMADDVVAVMDALGLERAALVGWSDGGNTALDVAVRYPKRVSKLVAYAANYDLTGLKGGGGPTFAAYLARCAADHAKLSPTPKDFAGLEAALSPMWRSQPNFTAAQLGSITAPTLVLDGDHDEIIKQEHVKKLATLVPHAKLVLLKDASHFALFQKPEAFNAAVLEFLRKAP